MSRSSRIRAVLRCVVVGSITIGFTPLSSQASSITAADYPGGGSLSTGFPDAVGWAFTPTTDIVVTSLGVYDFLGDGFVDNHDVGIFTAAGAAVVTAAMTSGASGTFVAGAVWGTRFVDVAPVLLEAGSSYYILASTFLNDHVLGSIQTNPLVVWNGAVSSPTGSIFGAAVYLPIENGGFIGPNFQFDEAPAAVPEPSTLLMSAAGLAVVVLRRRRNRFERQAR